MTGVESPAGLLPAPWPHGEGRPWTAATAVWLTVFTSGCALLGAGAGLAQVSARGWLSRRRPPPSRQDGEPRPDAATTAAVLGILSGIPLVLLGWVGSAELTRGPTEPAAAWSALPVGIALLVGARRLYVGRGRRLLLLAAGAAALWGLVVLAAVDPGAWSLLLGAVVVLPLPVAIAVTALRRPVGAWPTARRT